MFREWRHLKMLKRSGRMQEPGGVRDIQPGGLCVRCPACPTADINLPANWDQVTPDMRYVVCRASRPVEFIFEL